VRLVHVLRHLWLEHVEVARQRQVVLRQQRVAHDGAQLLAQGGRLFAALAPRLSLPPLLLGQKGRAVPRKQVGQLLLLERVGARRKGGLGARGVAEAQGHAQGVVVAAEARVDRVRRLLSLFSFVVCFVLFLGFWG